MKTFQKNSVKKRQKNSRFTIASSFEKKINSKYVQANENWNYSHGTYKIRWVYSLKIMDSGREKILGGPRGRLFLLSNNWRSVFVLFSLIKLAGQECGN